MSLFWRYFRDTLGFPLIFKAGPLAQLAKGGAAALDAVRENILWLRKQFLPETAEAEYLDLYAASRGIRRHSTESPDSFASRVIFAYAWQRLGGRHWGLPKIFDLYGFPGGVITNLRDTDPARWAEFLVDLTAPADLSANAWDTVAWLANEYKPARSKLAGIRFVKSLRSNAPAILAVPLMGETTTLYPWSASTVAAQSPIQAAITFGPAAEITTIFPKEA